jgi:hypothetical protein
MEMDSVLFMNLSAMKGIGKLVLGRFCADQTGSGRVNSRLAEVSNSFHHCL